MKKPKEIKFIFLLVFLFLGNSFFSQKDSAKFQRKTSVILKVGTNYFPKGFPFYDKVNINERYGQGHGLVNPIINFPTAKDNYGIYFSAGIRHERSKLFSMYFGFYHLNYKREFSYSKNVRIYNTPSSSYTYSLDIQNASGFIIQSVIGLEWNFEFKVKNTRFIASPFCPSIFYTKYKVTKKEVHHYEVVNLNETFMGSETGNFSLDRPFLAFGLKLPVYFGVEQEIPLKKSSLLVGAKGAFFVGFQFSLGYSLF